MMDVSPWLVASLMNEVERIAANGIVCIAHERGEDRRHDNHHEERVQDGPRHAQDRATIPELEVLAHKLLDDEAVALRRRIPGILARYAFPALCSCAGSQDASVATHCFITSNYCKYASTAPVPTDMACRLSAHKLDVSAGSL